MAPCLRHLPEQVLILAKVMACGNFVKRVRLQELYRSSACSIVDVRCSRKVPSFEWGCECHFRCSEPKLQLSPTTYHAGRDYATNAPVEYHCTKSCQHFIGVDTTLLPSRISLSALLQLSHLLESFTTDVRLFRFCTQKEQERFFASPFSSIEAVGNNSLSPISFPFHPIFGCNFPCLSNHSLQLQKAKWKVVYFSGRPLWIPKPDLQNRDKPKSSMPSLFCAKCNLAIFSLFLCQLFLVRFSLFQMSPYFLAHQSVNTSILPF